MIGNLDDVCPIDGRPVGDHTLREWDEHAARPSIDVPYEDLPDGLAMAATTVAPFADTVDTRALVGTYDNGALKGVMPCLELHFQIGHPDRPPDTVTTVTYIAPPSVMRKFGKLVRDAANGAANAAERAGATG